jgi:hypothetical protein
MTTVVGIFDAPEDVEDVTQRLAAAELDATVLDKTSLEQEPGSLDPAVPALAPGAAAKVIAGREEPTLLSKRDQQILVKAFRARLAEDHDLPDEAIEGYATTFSHGGTFVLVRANDNNAERAMQILRDAGAARVSRHD